MTLPQAFQQLVDSPAFVDASKARNPQGVKYRTYRNRFQKGELKSGAIVEMLQAHGYEISAKRVVKKK